MDIIPAFNLQAIAVRALVSLCVCLACLWVGYGKGKDAKQGEWDASTVADSKAREESMQTAARAIAAMIPLQAKTTERVTHEVETNTVYRDCVVPASGLRLLNDSITGTTTEPASGDGVQATATHP